MIINHFEKWRDSLETTNVIEAYTNNYIAMTRVELERLLYNAWLDGYTNKSKWLEEINMNYKGIYHDTTKERPEDYYLKVEIENHDSITLKAVDILGNTISNLFTFNPTIGLTTYSHIHPDLNIPLNKKGRVAINRDEEEEED